MYCVQNCYLLRDTYNSNAEAEPKGARSSDAPPMTPTQQTWRSKYGEKLSKAFTWMTPRANGAPVHKPKPRAPLVPKSTPQPPPPTNTPASASTQIIRSAKAVVRSVTPPRRSSSPPVKARTMPSLQEPEGAASKRAYNILSDLQLKPTDLETVPEQIRAALHKRKVRVIDLFRQLDRNGSGCISGIEFMQAMRDFGLKAPPDAVQAVFHSFDPDANGTIEFEELHELLIRSVFRRPRLEPLKTRAQNSSPLRTKPVRKADANLLGDAVLAFSNGNSAIGELSTTP